MTAPRPTLGEAARPIAAASVWWQGRPLDVTARHFVAATAQAAGVSEAEILGHGRGEPARWRRLGLAAAGRCAHLTCAAVAEAFERDPSAVAHAMTATAQAAASDPEVGRRIAEIQWRAMELAVRELMEGPAK
ncbi:hypothetical protein [Albimonas pacifica]|uniref:DnaA protein helix-turn-helix n=1 Tax=Albimonas pacifica TaxID=1114924 RepID=A0A1I3PV86_9RHOB|nr:hypothetical protein [Albimonas pacifica]SFJ25252.1 hypothetical protein SAMN05216258_12115 [Albimonas pacifica]